MDRLGGEPAPTIIARVDRRLLTGLIVLGVAVAIGVGILVLGGDDDSDDSPDTTNAALSNDERPTTTTGDGGDEGDGKAGGGDKGGDEGNDGSNGGGSDGGGTGQNGGSDEPTGPPIEQDPPSDGGGEPIGDPADVAAVTDTLTIYLESIASGDGEGACGQLSESGVKTMLKKLAKVAPETRGSPCPQAILLYQGAYGESAVDPSFKSIEISGGSATAVGPLKEPARLSATGDGWLIDEYGQ